ncbi:hypothetical protein GDO86_003717 [Hymenochirus boettgeri]|uniref:CHCH domain-containing protein n=1 Tax=Hymenochirus boettgeri TaxID=247094 RepID=A0A8T2K563_9PIPI|nr:hypothetical protein GDO86_003717 [Hymenochirus boettgeri]
MEPKCRHNTCCNTHVATAVNLIHNKFNISMVCIFCSPVIQRIRTECLEPFVAFEQCLKENQTAVEKCSKYVTDFLRCAENVKITE